MMSSGAVILRTQVSSAVLSVFVRAAVPTLWCRNAIPVMSAASSSARTAVSGPSKRGASLPSKPRSVLSRMIARTASSLAAETRAEMSEAVLENGVGRRRVFLRRLGEQFLLRTEVAIDQSLVDAGRHRDLAGTGALDAVLVLHTEHWHFYVAAGLLGLGFAMATMPTLLNSEVALEQTSVANSVNQTLRSVGGSIGTAVATAVLAANTLIVPYRCRAHSAAPAGREPARSSGRQGTAFAVTGTVRSGQPGDVVTSRSRGPLGPCPNPPTRHHKSGVARQMSSRTSSTRDRSRLCSPKATTTLVHEHRVT
jgi:hypothetical protein